MTSVAVPPAEPSPDEVATAQQATQHWNAGNHAQALDLIRPLADSGRPWAQSLTAWFFIQQGFPTIEQALPYAVRASEQGVPWAASQVISNLFANAAAAPHLVESALDMMSRSAPLPIGLDPIGQGWNLLVQGSVAQGIRLLGLRWHYPVTPEGWDDLRNLARARLDEIDLLKAACVSKRDEVQTIAETARTSIETAQSELETSARQAGLMVTTVMSGSANSFYKDDAERNERQSRRAWVSGLFVLAAAAAVAVLPLIIHYVGGGPDYSSAVLFGTHAASTLALASFAGVLLARARARDVAAQRAGDLSTAMGTMISYSNQISDPTEKQNFMVTMGQLVLQAHLNQSNSSAPDESMTGVLALANLLRSSPGGPATGQ